MNQWRKPWLRLGTMLTVVALVSGGTSAAEEADWVTRTVSSPYTAAGGVAGVASGTIVVGGERYGGAVLIPGDDEVLVSLRVSDETGRPVLVEASQDRDDVAAPDPGTTQRFCGATAEPLAVRPSVPLTVRIVVGPCGGDAVSLPTSGVVEATFLAPR